MLFIILIIIIIIIIFLLILLLSFFVDKAHVCIHMKVNETKYHKFDTLI